MNLCQHVNVNTSRLWFIRKTRVKKNTSKGEKVNSLGFYALNGKSVYLDTDSHKQDDVVSFLYKIRRENLDEDIVLVWDNARVHWSRKVRDNGRKTWYKTGIFTTLFTRSKPYRVHLEEYQKRNLCTGFNV